MTYDALPRNGDLPRRSLSIGSWLRFLITDRRILWSWVIFLAFSGIYAWFVFQTFRGQASSPPIDFVLIKSAVAGYFAWSYYWGVPGCLGILRRLAGKARLFFGLSTMGCMAVGLFLTFAFLTLIYYPPLGGGLFHFLRRWWLSGKGPQNGNAAAAMPPSAAWSPSMTVPSNPAPMPVSAPPPAAAVPAPVQTAASPAAPESAPDIEQRLRALTQLYDRGLISRDEYDRRRGVILDKI